MANVFIITEHGLMMLTKLLLFKLHVIVMSTNFREPIFITMLTTFSTNWIPQTKCHKGFVPKIALSQPNVMKHTKHVITN